MLKSGVRRIGVEKLADPQLLQFAQSGELLGVNDGDDGWRKCHRSVNAEKINRALIDDSTVYQPFLWKSINIPVIDYLLRGHLAQLLEDGTPREHSALHPFTLFCFRLRARLFATDTILSLSRRQLD